MKDKINLNGEWKLYYYPQKLNNIEHPEDLENQRLKGIAATVPGNVELDLSKAGELPEDLFYANNIHLLKKYEGYEWWYEKKFTAPKMKGKKVDLVFNGVDCIAEYWLNGQIIGKSENMFIAHHFDITSIIKPGQENIVHVRLSSPVEEALKKTYNPIMIATPTCMDSLWIRKAAHSYGWDIMPRVLSAGLWRAVEIVYYEEPYIDELFFYTESATEKHARIGVYYEIKTQRECFDELVLNIEGKCGDSIVKSSTKVRFPVGTVFIEIEDPKLWWPVGYGAPNLYQITTTLLKSGSESDTRNDLIGVRTVELLRTDMTSNENPGEFLFKINSIPVMAKGSNHVPLDVFHSRDSERYEEVVQMYEDIQCNIIRCWGGNVYEDHAFYELCDKKGIMVWQDFGMACGFYPQYPEFYRLIENEATQVIKELRNHCSIILWCGDNECDEFVLKRGFKPSNNKITREILPKAAMNQDPYRPYLESSPYVSDEVFKKNDINLMPENHLWGPRDYYKSDFYEDSAAHFVSETGYHGCPGYSSISKFIDEEHMWPWQNNGQWITHCTDPTGEKGKFAYRIPLMANQVGELFGHVPENIREFIKASQISQAEAKKYFIERARIKKWRMTGVIWWNLIDGWPQFSDAVVDYYYNKKLAYYYIKRIQEPVCVMIDEPKNWHATIVVSNDTLDDINGCYQVRDADTEEILSSGKLKIKANENTVLDKIKVSRGEHRLFLIEWEYNDRKCFNHYLHGYPPFNLDKYKEWLVKIGQLDNSFDASRVGD